MRRNEVNTIEVPAGVDPVKKLGIEDVSAFRCCLTCVYRKPYPAAMRNGRPVFHRFYCSLAVDSLRPVVGPADACPHWMGVTLEE